MCVTVTSTVFVDGMRLEIVPFPAQERLEITQATVVGQLFRRKES